MKSINKATQLDAAIAVLEKKQEIELIELKRQFNSFYNELKPTNLLENVIDRFKQHPEVKSSFVNSALSLASGYVSGKLINNPNWAKKIAGYGLQYLLTNFVAKKNNN